MLPDGRFIIHTVAGQRFLVKEKRIVDSLYYADVNYFCDEPEDLSHERFSLLSTSIYNQLLAYITDLKSAEQNCIFNALGRLPPYTQNYGQYQHGVPWIWWGLAALPLNLTTKLVFLRSKCVSERMLSLQRFLRFLTNLNNASNNSTAGTRWASLNSLSQLILSQGHKFANLLEFDKFYVFTLSFSNILIFFPKINSVLFLIYEGIQAKYVFNIFWQNLSLDILINYVLKIENMYYFIAKLVKKVWDISYTLVQFSISHYSESTALENHKYNLWKNKLSRIKNYVVFSSYITFVC